ncbi:MAG: peptidase MA family metallohydrolase [Chloroflexota bacterium]
MIATRRPAVPAARRFGAALAAVLVLVVLALAGAVPALGQGSATFDPPTASGALGTPLHYATTLRSAVEPVRIELLTRLKADPTLLVDDAAVTAIGGDAYEARVVDTSHIAPNSTFLYRFRATFPDGTTVESPEASVTVADERYDWKTRSNGVVTLHWYEGDEAFADRALQIGSAAIEKAAKLLGVTDMPPVDFFIYADQSAFYDALGPGTRENVGGQANSSIGTMFGLITPGEVDSDWVDTLVSHELTHLVFAEAVRNPYHFPPRWLNEGVAVHMSTGLEDGDRADVAAAARAGTIIPLEGLAGLFPTQRDRFSLAYAESSSAVDFLVSTYGEETLAKLITSYAQGRTDDEAFTEALGMDMRGFDDAWLASVGATRPSPFGPQPAPPGPVPAAWASPGASPAATSAPVG